MAQQHDRPFRVHLTNIAGTGAVQLVASLLPALERARPHRLESIYLPDRGPLSDYRRVAPGDPPVPMRRRLPNALSRMLECLVWARRFDGTAPLLVLGDLPLRCEGRQVVFVQTSHLTKGDRSGSRLAALKYIVSRAVFRANLRHAAAFIVQGEAMKTALEATYPPIRGRVHVVPQPVPAWLLEAGLRRTGRCGDPAAGLSLFYPAAPYPHKNHRLLTTVLDAADWPVRRLVLTVPPARNPAPHVPWIECVGLLAPEGVLAAYAEADALVFLSNAESYGLPLVEAMWIGLPIVCPDLPYARALCGDDALYFDPMDARTLRVALESLHLRLAGGWWPDWHRRLEAIPKDWETVANAMLDVVFPSRPGSPPGVQTEPLAS